MADPPKWARFLVRHFLPPLMRNLSSVRRGHSGRYEIQYAAANQPHRNYSDAVPLGGSAGGAPRKSAGIPAGVSFGGVGRIASCLVRSD